MFRKLLSSADVETPLAATARRTPASHANTLAAGAPPLRVVTANVRYAGAPEDDEQGVGWAARRPVAREAIRRAGADLVLAQEVVVPHQWKDVKVSSVLHFSARKHMYCAHDDKCR